MDKIQNGWFSEINDQWPGQALSLEVEEILFEGKSKHQDILVFKRYQIQVFLVLPFSCFYSRQLHCMQCIILSHFTANSKHHIFIYTLRY